MKSVFLGLRQYGQYGQYGPILALALSLPSAAACAAEATGVDEGLIVFSSNRSGPWRIWLCSAVFGRPASSRQHGSDLRPLTQGDYDGHDVDPVFSPDGKSVLFSSTRGETVGVWQASLDGSKPKRICDGDQAEWSPDGKSIVLRRDEKLFTHKLGVGVEKGGIEKGGVEKRISPEDWPHPSGPAWSPDGKTIAFACRWDAGNAIFLVAAGADGLDKAAGPVKVYDKKGACEPHFSPDGKRLVYETETNICTIAPDGTKNRPVTYFGGVQRYGRFSPDGRWIVFCQGPSERGPWQLYRIPAQGGTPIRITEEGSDMYPDWK